MCVGVFDLDMFDFLFRLMFFHVFPPRFDPTICCDCILQSQNRSLASSGGGS